MKLLSSRKFITAIVSMAACLVSLALSKIYGYNYIETVIVVPSVVLAISIICVTYLTGQAKIDIQESISVGGSSARQNNQ